MFAWLVMPARGQEPPAPDLAAQINGYERAAHSSFVGVPTDWSSSHLVFSKPEPGSEAEEKVQQDPRYWLHQIRRSLPESDDSIAAGVKPSGGGQFQWPWPPPPPPPPGHKEGQIKKDWSENMGSGAKVGAGVYPAKYSFGSTNANCASPGPPDFVVFNTGLAGAAGAAATGTGTYTGDPTNGQTATVDGTALTASANVTATGTITIGNNPSSWSGTNSVTVGSTTYTFTTGTPGTNQVSLVTSHFSGTTNETDTAINLNAAINHTATCNSPSGSACYGSGTVANASATSTQATNVVSLTSKGVGAGGNFTLTAANGNAGNITVSGGNNGNTASNTGSNFQVGGGAVSDATNLVSAINRNNPPSNVVTASNGGGTSATVTVTANTPGTGGNSITLATNQSNFTWSGGTLAGGTDPQATIVAYDNLYSGCTGTVPSVYWQYNTSYPQGSTTNDGSTIVTSTTLSSDGSQLAFVQSNSSGVASLVLLKWKSNSSLVQLDTATNNVTPANYRTCTAPCMTRITFDLSHNDTTSGPFYNSIAGADTLYVGDDPLTTGASSYLHKFTNAFLTGTPAETTTGGWPALVASAPLASPVYDSTSGNVFITSLYDGHMNGGRIHAVVAATAAITNSPTLGPSGTTAMAVDAPIVDSSAGEVYVFEGNDGSTNSVVDEFPTSDVTGTPAAPPAVPTQVTVGTSAATSGVALYAGAFDEKWFTSANSTGNLYVCGNTGGAPTLYQVELTAGAEVSSTLVKALASASTCSPVTEFYNSSESTDWLFMSVQGGGNLNTCSGACIYSFNATTATPVTDVTNVAGLASAGGSSGIVVDNDATSPTGASQVYFSTLSNQACTGGTGGCAVQAAQSGL